MVPEAVNNLVACSMYGVENRRNILSWSVEIKFLLPSTIVPSNGEGPTSYQVARYGHRYVETTAMFQLCSVIGQEPVVHAQLLRVETDTFFVLLAGANLLEGLVAVAGIKWLGNGCLSCDLTRISVSCHLARSTSCEAVWKLTSGIGYEAQGPTTLLATVGLSKVMLAMCVAWEKCSSICW